MALTMLSAIADTGASAGASTAGLGTVAGAGFEAHVHFHIVPRWDGDTNFMTVFAEVRVVPEHIQQTYKKLLPYFTKERLNESS